MDITADLYLRLKKARIEKGLSQNDVAKKLNISRQAVSRWETGRTVPENYHLVILSELYDVSIGELLGCEQTETRETETDTKKTVPSSLIVENEDSAFIWERLFLMILLILSTFFALAGLIVSPYIFAWTWRNRRQYKIILLLCAVCLLIDLVNGYHMIMSCLPVLSEIKIVNIN